MEIDGSSAFFKNKNSSAHKNSSIQMCFGVVDNITQNWNGIAVHCDEIDTANERVIKKWFSSFSQWRITQKFKMNVTDPSRPLFWIKYFVRLTSFNNRILFIPLARILS